jgi:hypothetical protein
LGFSSHFKEEKMKKINYLLIILLTAFCSCKKNYLDVQPVNLLTADQVFNSPEAVTAYFATLYRDLPIEDFNYQAGVFNTFPGDGNTYLANYTWESFNSNSYNGTEHGGNYASLYKAIRNVNTFLQQIKTVNIPDATKNAYTAEAQFVRAYYYFGLVKYFGGVPILLEPQQFSGGKNTSELNLPRNKEAEVWDLVRSDLTFAAANLPETSPYGRANKYVALALMSRAMLHAGSIAKFGTVQLNGVVGIDAAKANDYFKASYDASKAIIDGGRYSLFNKYPDKAQNFEQLFIELQGSPEAIFCKGYNYAATSHTHSQDLMVLPFVIRSSNGYGARLGPTVDMVEKFEYTDGSKGTLNVGTTKAFVHYPTPQSLFKDKDPRFFGSVISTFSSFKGTQITGQNGVIYHGNIFYGSNLNQYFDIPTQSIVSAPTSNSVPATGNSNEFNAPQLFWLKKWTDPVTDRSLIHDWTSRTDYMDMRYGEVVLNYAEAAFEMGNTGAEALSAINQIRTRAGIAPLTAIDRAAIRNERNAELAWENRTFWDLKRWRTLTTEFNIWTPTTLYMYYDIDTKDYVFEKRPNGGSKTYQEKHYYDQIPGDERNKNPLLVNNPGY